MFDVSNKAEAVLLHLHRRNLVHPLLHHPLQDLRRDDDGRVRPKGRMIQPLVVPKMGKSEGGGCG